MTDPTENGWLKDEFPLWDGPHAGLGLPSALFESYDQLRRNVAQEFGLQRAQVTGIDGGEGDVVLL